MTKGQTSYVVDFYTAVRIKKAGEPANYAEVEQQIIDKINSYVPSTAKW